MQMKARKTHYLISTHQLPGVYNSPFYPPQPSAKEIELRNARPLSRRSRLKQKSQLPADAAEILNHSRSIKIVSRESKSAPLPPISMKTTTKVQVSEDEQYWASYNYFETIITNEWGLKDLLVSKTSL